MAKLPTISFSNLAMPSKGVAVILMAEGSKIPAVVNELDKSGQLSRAVKVAEFTGKHLTSVNVIAPDEIYPKKYGKVS